MTKEGDIVLVYYEDKPAIYARIEAIEFDVKKDWFQITLLLLTIPLQTVTWILREEYINGTIFTMGGHSMRIEKIDSPVIARDQPPGEPISDEKNGHEKGKVIKFNKVKKD